MHYKLLLYFLFYLSENESSVPPVPSKAGPHPSNIDDKKRIIDQKLQEASLKGVKPTPNAVAQGFQHSRQPIVNQHHEDEDDDDDDDSQSFTTLHTNPPQKLANGHLPQVPSRESVNNNLLSSGDASQHTYDS
ncbi:unnamed protein product, partial [Rotaria magnacalcarata]